MHQLVRRPDPLPSDEPPENEEIADQLHRLLSALLVVIRDPSGRDPSLRQLSVLFVVASASNRPTIRGLAATLNIPKPSVSRAVDKLEQLGLAKRVPDSADRRSVLVGATRAGIAMTARLGAAYAARTA